jgi:phosphate transport system protein
MGALVEEAIRQSVESLKNRDEFLAQEVIGSDKTIDELELKVNEYCLTLLATRQPVAADLRFIDTAMKIATDLERMADLAVDIAERTLELADKPLLKPLIDIPKLAVLAQHMTQGSINAFVRRDVTLAAKICLMDDEADAIRNTIQDELMRNYIVKDGSTGPRAIPLLLVARFLERICDHATNICEDVIYMVKAEVVKHHLEKLEGREK